MFGLIAFTENTSEVIYRFTNEELMQHLHRIFHEKYEKPTENNDDQPDPDALPATFDDMISQHFAVLLRSFDHSLARANPLRRIQMENGSQVFFDQFDEKHLLCIADKSFDTVIVLKTINLFKATVKCHLGVLPFTYENIHDHLISRISATLQYFLINATTNQSILFESCEYLCINDEIRDHCRETCLAISERIERRLKVKKTTIFITCKDKIVHTHFNSNVRLSNADLFLLLLNTNSRCFREGFHSQQDSSRAIGHIFDTKIHQHPINSTTSARSSVGNSSESAARSNSCPGFSPEEFLRARNNLKKIHRSEVIFLKTTDLPLVPFTLLTIPLTDNVSMLILLQWDKSDFCSHLYQLVHHLDLCVRRNKFSTDNLAQQTKRVESHNELGRFLRSQNLSSDYLSKRFAEATSEHKSSVDPKNSSSQKEKHCDNVLKCLSNMSEISKKVFEEFFCKKDDYGHRSSKDADHLSPNEPEMTDPSPEQSRDRLRRNEHDVSTMIEELQKIINKKLGDWFAFFEVKAQRNITMNFCQNGFPGLVHFVFIDRRRGLICSPQLIPDETEPLSNGENSPGEFFLEKKILHFELECLSALHDGFTSFTVTDDNFIYNYILLLQESNGASMRTYKSIIPSHPPSILHFDFYNYLIEKNYPAQSNRSNIDCLELIAVHLNFVPPGMVHKQIEDLWMKLMNDEESRKEN